MNRLRPLEHWGRGFESRSSNERLCAFILFVLFRVYVAALRRADPRPRSSTDCL
jgi:hypothetical protein